MRMCFSPSYLVVKLSVALVGISLPCEKSCATEPPGCSTDSGSPKDGGRVSFLQPARTNKTSSVRFT